MDQIKKCPLLTGPFSYDNYYQNSNHNNNPHDQITTAIHRLTPFLFVFPIFLRFLLKLFSSHYGYGLFVLFRKRGLRG